MYYIPCSDQYLFVDTNHCIEHHLGAMNKPYDEYPLVYGNGDIYTLPCSDQHLMMFITVMSTHCKNNGDYCYLLFLPCNDQHLVMFIAVMSTHC